MPAPVDKAMKKLQSEGYSEGSSIAILKSKGAIK